MQLFSPEKSDSREFVFALVSVVMENQVAQLGSLRYLGTAFFVSQKGDAVTAAHVLPVEMEANRVLAAVLWVDGKDQLFPIGKRLRWEDVDFALVRIHCPPTKFFRISTPPLYMGTDVSILGISAHATTDDGTKQMRLLKGYIVTLTSEKLELSFPVPAGMSGSPVLLHDTVVGYATGRVRSEELEDSYEEIEQIDNSRERLTIIKSQRVTFYGVAHPFAPLVSVPLAALNDRTLAQYLSDQNG